MGMAIPQLDIPSQDPLDSDLLDPSPAAIEIELDRLPKDNISLAIRQTYTLLALLNRTELSADDRQQLMALFDRHCREFDQNYHAQLTFEQHSIDDQGFDYLLQLKDEMANGYKILLSETLTTHPQDFHLASLIFSILYYHGQRMLQHYDRYLVLPPTLWQESNSLFALSEDMHLQHIQVHSVAKEDAPSIVALYCQQLLLAISNPYHLLPGEHWLLYRYFGRWAPYCRLEVTPTETEYQGIYAVDLSQHEGPRRLFSEAPAEARMRFIQLQKLCMLIQQHNQDLDTGHPLEEFALPKKGHQERIQTILHELVHTWGATTPERQPRHDSDHYAGIVWGIDTIFQLLDPKLFSSLPIDGHILKATGRMVNESESGFCLRLPKQLREGFFNGQVLAIRSDQQSDAEWTLGLVRWQQHLGEKEFLVGIEYIKGVIRPTLLTDQEEPLLQNPALMVSTVYDGTREHRLVAPAGSFSLSEALEIELPKQQKRYDIKPRELLKRTPLIDFFSFKAEGSHAKS